MTFTHIYVYTTHTHIHTELVNIYSLVLDRNHVRNKGHKEEEAVD